VTRISKESTWRIRRSRCRSGGRGTLGQRIGCAGAERTGRQSRAHPNPAKPPLYFDFPIENGELKPLILTKWNANVPLAILDQYIPSLRTFKAIGIEVGTQDGLIGDNKRISEILTSYGIDHVYDTYEGNHTNTVAERYETRVLPFFSRELVFE
jgi:hypothetical protein